MKTVEKYVRARVAVRQRYCKCSRLLRRRGRETKRQDLVSKVPLNNADGANFLVSRHLNSLEWHPISSLKFSRPTTRMRASLLTANGRSNLRCSSAGCLCCPRRGRYSDSPEAVVRYSLLFAFTSVLRYSCSLHMTISAARFHPALLLGLALESRNELLPFSCLNEF